MTPRAARCTRPRRRPSPGTTSARCRPAGSPPRRSGPTAPPASPRRNGSRRGDRRTRRPRRQSGDEMVKVTPWASKVLVSTVVCASAGRIAGSEESAELLGRSGPVGGHVDTPTVDEPLDGVEPLVRRMTGGEPREQRTWSGRMMLGQVVGEAVLRRPRRRHRSAVAGTSVGVVAARIEPDEPDQCVAGRRRGSVGRLVAGGGA